METLTLSAVKPLLKKRKLSQRQLAERIGMDEGQLSRVLNQSNDYITLATLQRLADGLGMSASHLIKLCTVQEESK